MKGFVLPLVAFAVLATFAVYGAGMALFGYCYHQGYVAEVPASTDTVKIVQAK